MSERRREREVLKYHRCWLDALEYTSSFEQTTHPRASSFASSATKLPCDKSLLSFALLTCLRLGVNRTIISLNTSSHEYVLTEAGQSTPLVRSPDFDVHDDLWIREVKLPNSSGLSKGALHPPEYVTQDEDGRWYSVPALVVPDISDRKEFAQSVYASRPVKFFAAIPLVSTSGHHLGTLQIFDDVVRSKLSADQVRFMQDISATVLDHLDQLRSNAARYRGEGMLRGLSDFIQGRETLESISSGVTRKPHVVSPEPIKYNAQVTSIPVTGPKDMMCPSLTSTASGQAHGEDSKKASTSEASTHETTTSIAAWTEREPQSSHLSNKQDATSVSQRRDSASDELCKAYNRAASILREATSVDGVIFYDATSSKSTHAIALQDKIPTLSDEGESTEARSNITDTSSNSSRRSSLKSLPGTNISTLSAHTASQLCDILGISQKDESTAHATDFQNSTIRLSQRDLRRIITRYPRGKVFHYTDLNEASPSCQDTTDVDTDSASLEPSVSRSTETNPHAKAVADALLRAVPDAKIALFFPLFDFREQQWSTGCFMWSNHTESLLTARDVLSYIEAFGHSVNAETGRLKALAAEEAKATFIANVSHELRSPLHGILGSLEFLQEAIHDPFQAAMITTVETCSKTLLETVEHVLDYAKINSLSKRPSTQHDGLDDNNTQDAITKNFDIALSIEEVVEAVYAGQTFRAANPRSYIQDSAGDEMILSKDKDPPFMRKRTDTKYSGEVRLSLDIESRDNWTVRSQPGAVKRIVMNLLGNALKYTEKGSIVVTVREEETALEEEDSFLALYLSIKDTGRGMSADFLEKNAFKAFEQEDSFMAGTGLGLTIVQQLVRLLNGKMDIRSEKGTGTEVVVRLRLLRAEPESSASRSLLTEVKKMSEGLTLCILNPNHSQGDTSVLGKRILSDPVEDSVHVLSQNWFDMKVVRARQAKLVDADIFVYAEPPPIEYLREHHGEHVGKTSVPLILMTPNAYETALVKSKGIHKEAGIGNIIEVISQPCGPRKLARCLYRCLQRSGQLSDQSVEVSRSDTTNMNDDPETPPRTPRLRTETSDDIESQGTAPSSVDATDTRDDNGSADRNPSSKSAREPAADLPSLEQMSSSITPKQSRHRKVPEAASENSTAIDMVSEQDSRQIVLLVDDNNINLRLLITCAKRAKLPYNSATNGLEALQAYQRASTGSARGVRFVCMDLSMPVMDGITAVRHIRGFEKIQGIRPARIVALTGIGSDSVQREAARAGFDAFLTKPVSFKDLVRLLQE